MQFNSLDEIIRELGTAPDSDKKAGTSPKKPEERRGLGKRGKRILAFGLAITLAITTPSVNVGLMRMQAADDAELEEALQEDGFTPENEQDAGEQTPELISFKDEALTRAVEEGAFTIDPDTGKVTSAVIRYNGALLEMGTDFTADAVLKSENKKSDRIISTYDVTVTGIGAYTDFAIKKSQTVTTAIVASPIKKSAPKNSSRPEETEEEEVAEVASVGIKKSPATTAPVDLEDYRVSFSEVETYENETPSISLGAVDFASGYEHPFALISKDGKKYIDYETLKKNATIKWENNKRYSLNGSPATVTVTGTGTETAGYYHKVTGSIYYMPEINEDIFSVKYNGVEYAADAAIEGLDKVFDGKPAAIGSTTFDVTYNGVGLEYESDVDTPGGAKKYTVITTKSGAAASVPLVIRLGRYYGSQQISYSYKISPKAVDDSDRAGNIAVTYTNSFVYDGTAKKPEDIVVKYTTADSRELTLTEGVDYTITMPNAVNAGVYEFTVTGLGNYNKTLKKTFEITPRDFTDGVTIDYTLDNGDEYIYTGSEIKPAVTVKDTGILDGEGQPVVLTADTDYTVSYSDNTAVSNSAIVKVTGKGNYKETPNSKTFKIIKADPKQGTVTFKYNGTVIGTSKNQASVDATAKLSLGYNGSAQEPDIDVIFGGETLTETTDYTVAFSNNTDAGTATATFNITGDKYEAAEITLTFAIAQRDINSFIQNDGALTINDITLADDNEIIVKDGNNTLTKGTHYTLGTQSSSKNSDGSRIYTRTITGTGNYKGDYIITKDGTWGVDLGACTVELYDPNKENLDLNNPASWTELTKNGNSYDLNYCGEKNDPLVRVKDPEGNYIDSDKYTYSFDRTGVLSWGTKVTVTVIPKAILEEYYGTNNKTSYIVQRVSVKDNANITLSIDGTDVTGNNKNGNTVTIGNNGEAVDLRTVLSVKFKPLAQERVLTMGTDYTVAMHLNGTLKDLDAPILPTNTVETYVLKITGIGNYKDTEQVYVKFGPKNLNSSSITMRYKMSDGTTRSYIPDFTYDRNEHKVVVGVENGKVLLYDGNSPISISDYEVKAESYTTAPNPGDFTNEGTVTMTFTPTEAGKAKYTGSKTISYNIVKAQASDFTLKVTDSNSRLSTSGSEITYAGASTWTGLRIQVLDKNGSPLTPVTDYTTNVVAENLSDSTKFPVTPGKSATITVTGILFSGSLPAKTITVKGLPTNLENLKNHSLYTVEPTRLKDVIDPTAIGSYPKLELNLLDDGSLVYKDTNTAFDPTAIKVKDSSGADVINSGTDITASNIDKAGSTGYVEISKYLGTTHIELDITQKLTNTVWATGGGTEITVPWRAGGYGNISSLGDVKLGSNVLKQGLHYEIKGVDNEDTNVLNITNVGEHTIKLQGKSPYSDESQTLKVKILYDLSKASMTLSQSSFVFDGDNKKPTVTVNIPGNPAALVEDTDYTIGVSGDDKQPGKVTLTLGIVNDRSMNPGKTATYTIEKIKGSTITATQKVTPTYDPANGVIDNWDTYLTVNDTTPNSQSDPPIYNAATSGVANTYYVQVPAGFYRNNVPQAGTYELTVKALENEHRAKAECKVTFTIEQRSVTNISAEPVMYAGGQTVKPTTFKDGTYTVSPDDIAEISGGGTEVGSNSVSITGKRNYTGTSSLSYTIETLNLSAAGAAKVTVTGDEGDGDNIDHYTGAAHNPTVKVEVPSGTGYVELNPTMYTKSWEPSPLLNAGDYKLVITGNDGNVTGSKPIDNAYHISPKDEFAVDHNDLTNAYNAGDSVNISNLITVNDATSGTELARGTDYELSPATINTAGEHKITVTGLNNYADASETVTVKVGINIKDAFNVSTITREFDGTDGSSNGKIKEAFENSGSSLIYGTDYTVSGYNNISLVGTYNNTLKVTGVGKYYGTKEVQVYAITPQSGMLALVTFNDTRIHTDSTPSYTYYTGADIKPDFQVRVIGNGVDEIIPSTDYKVTYSGNRSVGTATATVKCINYVDTSNQPLSATQTFAIRAIPINSQTMTTVFASTGTTSTEMIYSGNAQTPQVYVSGTNPDGVSVIPVENTDYTVTYNNNTNVGKASVVVTGKGNFTGSKTLEFPIKGDFAASTSVFTIPTQPYTGAAPTALAGATVVVGGNTLKENSGYKVTYSSTDNYTTNGMATFTPVDTTYYTGSKTVSFTISKDSKVINSAYSVKGVANAYTYNGASIKPSVTVTDASGNPVTVEDSEITYRNTADGNSCIVPGMVTMTIPIKVGTETVKREVKYSILQKNINSCSMSSLSDVAYTGSAFTPSVTLSSGNGLLAQGTDYTLTYSNNVDPGTAKVRVTGRGNYTGTADLFFNIYMPMVKNLKASTTSSGDVKLTWTKPSEEFTGYRISYRPADGTQMQVNVGKNVTSKTFSNLYGGSTYIFIVQTYTTGAGGRTGYGDAVVATAATKTATPKITLKSAGTGKIKVSWKKISGASGYMIYRKKSGGTYKRIKTIKSGDTITYTNSGLVSGRKYVYRVIAYRTNGTKRTYSSYSTAKSITCK